MSPKSNSSKPKSNMQLVMSPKSNKETSAEKEKEIVIKKGDPNSLMKSLSKSLNKRVQIQSTLQKLLAGNLSD